MKPCLVISLNSSPVLQACGKPSSHLVESSGEIGETGKGPGTTTDAFERQLCFLSGLSQTHYNQLQKYLRHCTVFWLNGLSIFFVLYLTDLWLAAIWSKKGLLFVGVSQDFCNCFSLWFLGPGKGDCLVRSFTYCFVGLTSCFERVVALAPNGGQGIRPRV